MKKFLNLSKIAIAVFFVAIVLKGWQSCPAVDPLDHTVLLPNPDDCSSFFMCSNGEKILQKCPEGLHFNANINVCDWPQNAGCEESDGAKITCYNAIEVLKGRQVWYCGECKIVKNSTYSKPIDKGECTQKEEE